MYMSVYLINVSRLLFLLLPLSTSSIQNYFFSICSTPLFVILRKCSRPSMGTSFSDWRSCCLTATSAIKMMFTLNAMDKFCRIFLLKAMLLNATDHGFLPEVQKSVQTFLCSNARTEFCCVATIKSFR